MRVYLVIMDETEEASTALRFAASRAARTGGQVHLLALIPRQPFVAFSAIQATIEDEARARAEALVTSAAGSLMRDGGEGPAIAVRQGDGVTVIREYLSEHPEVSALVLGAAASGGPGPLVNHFAANSGQLPCPLYVIPGGMNEIDIDRLS
ncbi:MAG: universal stress protein [Sphingomonadales bacterium]|nr:universal stress protein [Sphingomonadales bacterium]